MFSWVLQKIIGTQNERELKRMKPVVEKINSLEPEMKNLSDDQLRAKTDYFRSKIKEATTHAEQEVKRIEKDMKQAPAPEDREAMQTDLERANKELKKVTDNVLNEILPEAFAAVRETGRRTINMRHFDVQLAGGIVLHEGKIAEMATGEGKTLVATLAVYLNALTGRGVHVVTVNDYLAQRDHEWMGPIYKFLGLSVGAIQHDMHPQQRRVAYNCDVTYGTNNEFGFDYLRDNMVVRKEDMVQRKHHYAIVDEVDSILIDEARTPLIISGPAEESTELYYKVDKIVKSLTEGKKDKETKEESGDYIVDEKAQTAHLTEQGEINGAKLLGIPNLHDAQYIDYRHHLIQALRAHKLFNKDVDYMIKDGQIVIVDEFTGRMMPGRRWSDGLHQGIEAKEGVKIERENQTLATITFQNYFRMYEKLAGMTGTAATEAGEFHTIYKLDVVIIPTNKPLIRHSYADVIYRTEKEKFKAVADEIEELYSKERPVLVGTISIEKSEKLSQILKKRGIPHNVLNARYHEREAHIVAQAGRLKAITIATNMAGRGTDIVLGGNAEFRTNDILEGKGIDPHTADPKEKEAILEKEEEKIKAEHQKVVGLDGLHVLATERHEARRIDNQLRGRSGRQGDPGSSRFYISLEDDLMRIFGGDRVSFIMQRLGMEEGQEIQHAFITKAIETSQRRVEAHNFDIRKHLLEYDNVMNRQREVIYNERRLVLEGENLKEHIFEMIDEILDKAFSVYIGKGRHPEEWDIEGLSEWLRSKFPIDFSDILKMELSQKELREKIKDRIIQAYEAKEKQIGPDGMRHLERIIMLQIIDSKWKDHLYDMDNLREGIGLRAYGQVEPLVAYTNEGFARFSEMIHRIKEETVEMVFRVQAVREEKMAGVFEAVPQETIHQEVGQFGTSKKLLTEETFPTAPPEQGPPPPGAPPSGPPPAGKAAPYKREHPKVGRNQPCPCGSGKKYKHCHGKTEE